MQVDQDTLKAENAKLAVAFRDKSRKHQQTQELYDRLKRKEMTAATQSAAFDSVDEVLQSVSNRQPSHGQYQGGLSPLKHFQDVHNTGDVFQGQHRDSVHEHAGNRSMMPPPFQRAGPQYGAQPFGQRECTLV